MTGHTSIAPHAAPRSAWWHGAVLKTVGGFAIGVMVIITVMATMAAVPELKQAGIDAGIALSSQLQLTTSTKLGLREGEQHAGIKGYVFVDLDAGRVLANQPGVSAGEVACARLIAEDRSASRDCYDPAITDRALLARVLRQVAAAGPRAVVVDVELGGDHPQVNAGDDARLRGALSGVGDVPVFYVIPTDAVAQLQTKSTPRLQSNESDFFRSANVRGLPAEMSPGAAARSFPHCYLVRRSPSSEEPLPAIPRAVSAMVKGKQDLCLDAETARSGRIVYTLPSTDVDADGETLAAQDPAARALQIKLNQVYNRCLAASLWSADSACARPEYFNGRVVVIGSSASYRGDWHYTPLGEMPGPLILINAIRSEILFGEAQGKSLLGSFGFKLLVLLACTLIWFVYWLQDHYRHGRAKHAHGEETRIEVKKDSEFLATPTPAAHGDVHAKGGPATPVGPSSRTLDAAALLVTIGAVIWISYAMSYSPMGADHGLDVLLPGLTVGVEVFVELMSTLVGKLERWLAHKLGWEATH